MWGTFGKLEQNNQLVVKNVLERDVNTFKSKAEKKAKLYYESCLDDDELMEKMGGEPLVQFLRQIGGWTPSESGFNASAWTLPRTLKTLQNKYNMGGLFSWVVAEDDRNSTRHIIQIDQGGLSLPTRENYLNKTANTKVLAAYLEYMVKVAVLLGGNETLVTPQMTAIIDFETRLANITSKSLLKQYDKELLPSCTKC